jgi:hypothetical protein
MLLFNSVNRATTLTLHKGTNEMSVAMHHLGIIQTRSDMLLSLCVYIIEPLGRAEGRLRYTNQEQRN